VGFGLARRDEDSWILYRAWRGIVQNELFRFIKVADYLKSIVYSRKQSGSSVRE
jgi:hypothetical protein